MFLFLFLLVSENVKSKIDSIGFAIVPSYEKNIYDLYEKIYKEGEPLLLTQDLVLHTAHILFDYSLRVMELDTLLPKLKELSIGMLEKSINELNAKEEKLNESAELLVSYFSVACKLLDIDLPKDIPQKLMPKINEEVMKINQAAGILASTIFGYKEDYTQYKPRGHYTRNAYFENYFKSMMWYGRIGFYFEPNPTMYERGANIDTKKEGIKFVRTGIFMTRLIKNDKKLFNLWKDIYTPTAYFVGKADDFTIDDFIKLDNNVKLTHDKCILDFIEEAKKYIKPKIISIVVEDTSYIPYNFRFIGQRFIPDAYIMQNLVYPKVKKYLGTGKPFTAEYTPIGLVRCFPRLLDVLYVLGSNVAGDILKNLGDTDYENYNEHVEKLKYEFNKFTEKEWSKNLYWRWLYALKLLINYSQKENAPDAMKSIKWKIKELNTALGSLSELRHDTILYGKQSYTLLLTAIPKEPEFPGVYVEPYPEIYKWLSEFVSEINNAFAFPTEVKDRIKNFADILDKLSVISNKQLKYEPLTEEEERLVWHIGKTFKNITKFSDELMKKITTGTDEEMAIVSDVHTDPNSNKVLEEAVGYPSIIYVKIGNKIYKGGVFSYYEFKNPMQDRLTDEEWQSKLKTKRPEFESWFTNLVVSQ